MELLDYNITRICRVCKSEASDMWSIYQELKEDTNNPRIDEMLMACAAIQVNIKDGLPSLICQVCVQQLQASYAFKMRCEDTDTTLREYNKTMSKMDGEEHDDYQEELGLHNLANNPGVTESLKFGEVPPPAIVTRCDFIEIMDNNQLILTCRECFKVFTTLDGLKCHKRVHTGALFKCRQCDKEYTRLNHLQRHELSHGRRKVHVCKICNKTLTRFEHLKRHLVTHLKEKPYSCGKCNRGFNRAEHLANHAERCKGDRTHICDICNKGFNRADSLEVHRALHGDNIPAMPTIDNLDNIEQHYLEIDCENTLFEPSTADYDDLEDVECLEPHVSIVTGGGGAVSGEQEDCKAALAAAVAVAVSKGEVGEVDDGTREVEDGEDYTGDGGFDDDPDYEDDELLDRKPNIKVEHEYATKLLESEGGVMVKDIPIGDDDNEHDPGDGDGDLGVDNHGNEDDDDEDDLPLLPKGSLNPLILKISRDNITTPNDNEDSDSDHSEYTPQKVLPRPTGKRGRGRPRKNAYLPVKIKHTGPPRKRGRPRKDSTMDGSSTIKIKDDPDGDMFAEMLGEEIGEDGGTGIYPCTECGAVFNRLSALDIHAKKHPGRKLFTCRTCDKRFSRSTHLKRHMMSHSVEKPFSCDICTKRFNRRDHLSQHMKLHSRAQEFECDICKRPFSRPDQLLKHKANKHGQGDKVMAEKRFKCTICSKCFTTEKYRDVHMKGHSGEKRYRCKTCDKLFLSKSHLTEHMKFHNDNSKKFLCSECGQRFIRNDYLVIHMRRHRGEKPFKCKFCGKGFPRTTDLTVHERYHTGEKTHLCVICGRGFGRAYNLTVHMRTHTGEKPYQCTYCDAAFAQGNDLKAHVRRHTGERFQCEYCTETFLMGYLLTQHKRTVHGLNVVSNIRRLQPVKKLDPNNPDEPPPITIPLPTPVIPSNILNSQMQQLIELQQQQHQLQQPSQQLQLSSLLPLGGALAPLGGHLDRD